MQHYSVSDATLLSQAAMIQSSQTGDDDDDTRKVRIATEVSQVSRDSPGLGEFVRGYLIISHKELAIPCTPSRPASGTELFLW